MNHISTLWLALLAHPELFPFLAWPIFTALASFWHTDVEPRYPRFVAFVRATGIDVPRAWAAIRVLAPKVPPLPPAFGVVVLLVGSVVVGACLGGCASSADALRGAVDASDVSSHLEIAAAPTIESMCVAPMQALASAPLDGRQAKVDALDTKCKPLVGAYDTERRAHLLLIAGIVKAEANGAITLGTILQLADDLDVAVGALVKELGR